MKKLLFFLLLGTLCLDTNAQTYQEFVKKADSSMNAKDYVAATEYYKKAFAAMPNAKRGFYNAACVASLANNKELSFVWLNTAIENGFDNIRHLKQDTDLENLHSDTRWEVITANLQKKVDIAEANYDKPLQQELLSIFNDDQAIRQEYIQAQQKYGYQNPKVDSLGKIMMLKDSINVLKIVKILDEKGWVGQDKIGQQANQTLFLVVQHSDLKTQQKYLPMMRIAVEKGNANMSSLALLEDRVALGEGKKQIYGSQIGYNSSQQPYILPLEDPDNVDKRREQAGLAPLAEYVKNWGIIWNLEAYKNAK